MSIIPVTLIGIAGILIISAITNCSIADSVRSLLASEAIIADKCTQIQDTGTVSPSQPTSDSSGKLICPKGCHPRAVASGKVLCFQDKNPSQLCSAGGNIK